MCSFLQETTFLLQGLDQTLNEALANICEGVCQPLKIRIEKILNVSTQASTLYAVVNMLRYVYMSVKLIQLSKGDLL